MTTASHTAPAVSGRRRVWFRVGLVLAGLMGLFNTINGVGTLADPTFGQTDPAAAEQPGWMSVSLVVFGVTTLAALIPAWRGVRGAIIAVAVSRLAEAWSAVILPFLPDAPAGIMTFVVALVVVGTAVSLMVAQGLRRAA